ncbi:transposase [Actinokineospora globicatena]|uniref:transposase n=1 Tax=Actinokineospora globicatena TaxID=103729 RepID=UPI0020A4E195|nr:transposase [Actinokineospora globicatena]MCP2303913.1 putative transposase of IS4/5 family (DUF4096) [Actinokineospora globicatena]GLW78927.1 hypothetical protein Aglo01_34090 [Actinokineospora globicatena]GLW86661.1 hypothetical protein Aglo02_43000 [Actinokineospora globicatena]
MDRFTWLAPMALWPHVEPLLPRPVSRPQGGGTPRAQNEASFAAIAYVLTSGCAWREVPKVFGVSWQTAHRRFAQWAGEGVWTAIGLLVADTALDEGVRCWANAITAAANTRLGASESASQPPGDAAARRPRPRIIREFSGTFVERLFGPRKVVQQEISQESPETSSRDCATT